MPSQDNLDAWEFTPPLQTPGLLECHLLIHNVGIKNSLSKLFTGLDKAVDR